MPELPEVETIRLGLLPLLLQQRIERTIVRETRLRHPVPSLTALEGHRIDSLTRRGKYLLAAVGPHTLLLHLGMSGVLTHWSVFSPPGRHDHIDFLFANGALLRFTDPRRFGAVDLFSGDPASHPLLSGLGPEPLTEDFHGSYLLRAFQGRKAPVKSLLMDGRIVAGVGNIYACEALFQAGLSPERAAGALLPSDCGRLARAIQETLTRAIAAGGSTLRDFRDGQGKPGYFQHSLQVYGRAGLPCPTCGAVIQRLKMGGRGSFFCPECQR